MNQIVADLMREIDILVRARYPIIAVQTFEEPRFCRFMETLSQDPRHRAKGLYHWSRVKGLRQVAGPNLRAVGEVPIDGTMDAASVLERIERSDSGIFILADFVPLLSPYGQDDPILVRQLRELAWSIQGKPITVFLVGPDVPTSLALEKEVKIIDLPLPSESEVDYILREFIELSLEPNEEVKVDLDAREQERIVQALLGLTDSEIRNVLAKAALLATGLNASSVSVILDEKRDIIRQSGSLSYTHPESLSSLGGYPGLRQLLQEMAVTFTPEAREYGIEPSKGLLLVGLPGCGKDLCKKIAAGLFSRPLLDLDFGAVMGEGGGVIGQAALSIKRALAIATAIHGVLGISEFEKGLGGLESSGRSDSGETARTISILLNWMQEQRGEVFVFATANDVHALRPEQIRQGRFSKVAFVDLPTVADRRDILRVHLLKRRRDPSAVDLDELAEASEDFSGAELEGAVRDGILAAFIDGAKDVTTAHIRARMQAIQPLAKVKSEEIEAIRSWAKEHMAIRIQDMPASPKGRFIEF